MPAPTTTLPSPYPARIRLHRAPSGPRQRRASPAPELRAPLPSDRSASPSNVSDPDSEPHYSPAPSPDRPSLELFIPSKSNNRASTMTMASAFHDVGTLPVTPGLGLDLLMSQFDSLIRERGIPTATTWRPVLQDSVPAVAPAPIDLDTPYHRRSTDASSTMYSYSNTDASDMGVKPDYPSITRRNSFASTIGPDADNSSLDWYLRQRDDARSSFMSVSSRFTVELGTLQAGPEMDELKEQFALLMRENRALARSSKEALLPRTEDGPVDGDVVDARENPEPVHPPHADDFLDIAHSSSASSSTAASPSPSALSLQNRPESSSSSSSSSIYSAQLPPQPEAKVEHKNTRSAPQASKAAVPIRVTSVMRHRKPKARVLRITNPAGPPPPLPSSTTGIVTPRSASASFYATSSAAPLPPSPAPVAGPSSAAARPPSPQSPVTPIAQTAGWVVKPATRASRSRGTQLPVSSGPRTTPSSSHSTPNLAQLQDRHRTERKTSKASHSAPSSTASSNTTFTAASMSYHPWESSQPAAFKSVPILASVNAGSSGEPEHPPTLIPLVPNRWKDPSPETPEETRQSGMLGPMMMKRWLSKRWHRLNRA